MRSLISCSDRQVSRKGEVSVTIDGFGSVQFSSMDELRLKLIDIIESRTGISRGEIDIWIR